MYNVVHVRSCIIVYIYSTGVHAFIMNHCGLESQALRPILCLVLHCFLGLEHRHSCMLGISSPHYVYIYKHTQINTIPSHTPTAHRLFKFKLAILLLKAHLRDMDCEFFVLCTKCKFQSKVWSK